MTFVSSYDDLPLMQGHATLGLEIVDRLAAIADGLAAPSAGKLCYEVASGRTR